MNGRISLRFPSATSQLRALKVSIVAAVMAAMPAYATVDFPLTPLQVGSTVPPNIMFQLDDSGSMQFEIMPDTRIPGVGSRNVYYVFPPPANLYAASNYVVSSANPRSRVLAFTRTAVHNVVLRSPTRNSTFYNPLITYTPWRRADGTSFGNVAPGNAPWNPTNAAAGSVDLRAQRSANMRWVTCADASNDTNCTQTDGFANYWPVTFYVKARTGSDLDITRYDQYQYRTNQLYRRDLSTNTESAVTSVSWGSGSSAVTRTAAQELQNFANWFSYYRSRILAARAGASQAFADLGSGYRVGFVTINATSGTGQVTPVPPSSSTATSSYLPVPTIGGFDGANKSAFYQRLLETPIPPQGTPLRYALNWAGRYFQRTDDNGPWGPGDQDEQVTCRRNYTILTTDGYWNDNPDLSHIGNSDNTDGPSHGSAIPNRSNWGYTASRPYRDAHSNTLADIAMHYWKNDLRTDMPNNVPGTETDAFWQHMVTFGLSIGVQGTLNPDTDLPSLTSGARSWPNPTTNDQHKIDDLWHATVNSRGAFTAANNPDQFRLGLVQALRSIQNRNSSASNVSANSTQLNDGARVYQASFEVRNNEWVGDLKAYPISASGLSSSPSWSAQQRLRGISPSSRRIFTRNATSGVEFVWGNLSAAQQAALGSAAVVDYLRGNQSLEYDGSDAVGRPFRPRTELLGDIVNSSPAYSADTRTIFIGANDGMLHAFNADTGDEVFAYVPGLIVHRLRALSERTYLHEYFVDGDVAVSERSQTSGRNYLIGSLGRGGRGLFGLDVTTPQSFASSHVLWELSGDTEPDLGVVLGKPLIARTNSGEWVAIVGNGYNSANGRAVLFIIRLADGQVIRKLDTGVGVPANSNGLAAPAAFDADGNGTVDFVYAGDLQGHLWKFDLQAASASAWSLGHGGLPMFTAIGPDLQLQPITSRPAVVTNLVTTSSTYGQRFVLFGTGRYLSADDPSVTRVQSIYGLIDDGTPIVGRTQLRQRTITAEGNIAGRAVRTFSSATAGDMSGMRGWYLDLLSTAGAAQGERVVSAGTVANLAYPTFLIASVIPEVSQCTTSGRGYLNAIDPFNGGAVPVTIFDVNRDRAFNDGDYLGGNVVGSIDLGVGMGTEPVVIGTRAVQGGSNPEQGPRDVELNPGGAARVGRLSWREIVR